MIAKILDILEPPIARDTASRAQEAYDAVNGSMQTAGQRLCYTPPVLKRFACELCIQKANRMETESTCLEPNRPWRTTRCGADEGSEGS
jgi:hypothetical protein